MTSPCRGGFERVLYGWGKNAPAMSLPPGVGYSVGPGSAIHSLVLQVCMQPAYSLQPGWMSVAVHILVDNNKSRAQPHRLLLAKLSCVLQDNSFYSMTACCVCEPALPPLYAIAKRHTRCFPILTTLCSI